MRGSELMLEDIESLVGEILSKHEAAWAEGITDAVFLEIERSPNWMKRYRTVVEELDAQGKRGKQVVNQYIGRRVKLLTTGVNRGRCYSPRPGPDRRSAL